MALSISTDRSFLQVRTRVREAEAFQLATTAAVNSANMADSIETIMRLALKANTESVRYWAATWLQQSCGVRVAS